MKKVIIYHNSRCSKSRSALSYLHEKGIEPEIREYLKDSLSKDKIATLLSMLGDDVKNILRTNEEIYRKKYKDKELAEKEIIDAIFTDPILMERPIVINSDRAIIARPAERLDEII